MKNTTLRLMTGFFLLCGLIIFTQSAFALPFRSELNRGNDHYKKGDYSQAENVYGKILDKKKNDLKARFNLGDSLYKEGRFKESEEVFKSLADAPIDKNLREKAFYNLGNSFFMQEDYKNAIGAYEEALKLDPKDKDAKSNLELAKKIQAMPKQKKKNKNKKQKKDEKKKNDRNKNDGKNKDKDKNKEQQNQNQPKPGQMSKEDALRILNALEDKEKHKDQKLKAGRGIINAKDW